MEPFSHTDHTPAKPNRALNRTYPVAQKPLDCRPVVPCVLQPKDAAETSGTLNLDIMQTLRQLILETLIEEIPRITAQHKDTWYIFDARQVARFYACGNYVLFTIEGHEYFLNDTLSSMEKRLERYSFVRIHRSELINLNHVWSVRPDNGGLQVTFRDGQTAQVSRRMVPTLKRHLDISAPSKPGVAKPGVAKPGVKPGA